MIIYASLTKSYDLWHNKHTVTHGYLLSYSVVYNQQSTCIPSEEKTFPHSSLCEQHLIILRGHMSRSKRITWTNNNKKWMPRCTCGIRFSGIYSWKHTHVWCSQCNVIFTWLGGCWWKSSWAISKAIIKYWNNGIMNQAKLAQEATSWSQLNWLAIFSNPSFINFQWTYYYLFLI